LSRNERLLDALNRAALTPTTLAEQLAVDQKTVERWITQGRIPYPRHRHQLAAALREPERWLWPHAVDDDRRANAARSEVVRVYAHRHQIPGELWLDLFRSAGECIDVLVYAGLFLPEQTPGLCELFIDKADAGVQVRLLVGDPECEHVRIRGEEEGIGGTTVATKIGNVLHLYRSLFGTKVQMRLHATTLYTSIYRADEKMIASPHVLGLPGAQSPALHLRRLDAGDLFDTYATCFDRVWACATPYPAG
jgi:excisionase family DNA binding protein